MKSALLLKQQWLLGLRLKILLQKEQMGVADCQQRTQSQVGTSCGPAEWLWEGDKAFSCGPWPGGIQLKELQCEWSWTDLELQMH